MATYEIKTKMEDFTVEADSLHVDPAGTSVTLYRRIDMADVGVAVVPIVDLMSVVRTVG